jgi:hypothetical protein
MVIRSFAKTRQVSGVPPKSAKIVALKMHFRIQAAALICLIFDEKLILLRGS